jgi:N-acetylglutamate synthase-like GNAT family acetyltransferase
MTKTLRVKASEYDPRAMTTPNQQVRRATVEDIQKLVALWQQENLPSQELEKRFKEFQLMEGESGKIMGAIGFHIVGQEAFLHSEAFKHPEQSELVREKLWDRVQIMARNHGLIRVWTQMSAPFWPANGFGAADEGTLAKLPAGYSRSDDPYPWTYIQLRDEVPMLSIDKEFALFKEAEHEQTERMLRQAKTLKVVAAGIAVIVFLMVIVWALYFFRLQKRRMSRQASFGNPAWALKTVWQTAPEKVQSPG